MSVRGQGGFALAAAMMVLALLSVLGIAALQSTTVEVKISAHDRDARAALYLAEAALEEARYYASRGWGKIAPYATQQVRVETATPRPPGFSWDGNRYAGFLLLAENGDRFEIAAHSDDSVLNPVLSLTAGDPIAGRFALVREIPAADAAWTGTRLEVDDGAWATLSGSDTWKGWLLWNADGRSYKVGGSGVTGSLVTLTLSTDPAPGPYLLALNPWLEALIAPTTGVPEDHDPTLTVWDRDFPGVGVGRVTATRTTAGSFRDTYLLTSVGSIPGPTGAMERTVIVRVHHAGIAGQRVGDWAVR